MLQEICPASAPPLPHRQGLCWRVSGAATVPAEQQIGVKRLAFGGCFIKPSALPRDAREMKSGTASAWETHFQLSSPIEFHVDSIPESSLSTRLMGLTLQSPAVALP